MWNPAKAPNRLETSNYSMQVLKPFGCLNQEMARNIQPIPFSVINDPTIYGERTASGIVVVILICTEPICI